MTVSVQLSCHHVHISLEQWSNLFVQILMFTLECAYYQQTHCRGNTEAASEVA